MPEPNDIDRFWRLHDDDPFEKQRSHLSMEMMNGLAGIYEARSKTRTSPGRCINRTLSSSCVGTQRDFDGGIKYYTHYRQGADAIDVSAVHIRYR